MRKPLYDPQTDRVLSPVYPSHECEFVTRESIFRHPPELDVSVVVPCYNAERFLPGCLESLAAQQASCSYEVILVDDGSWDRTGELLEKAAAERGSTRPPWPGRVREKGTSPVKLCNSPLSHRYTVVTSATPSRSVPPSVGSRPVTAGRARL